MQAETAQALSKRGPKDFRGSNYPPMPDTSGSTKTRQQVIDEYTSETPAQRKARLQMFRG